MKKTKSKVETDCIKTIDSRGTIRYYKVSDNINDQYDITRGFHRMGGPAIIYPNGTQEWYVNGILHRESGPAIVDKVFGRHEWYWQGERLSQQQFHAIKINGFVEQALDEHNG